MCKVLGLRSGLHDESAGAGCGATTVSQLKMCEFSGESFKGFQVL
jgi:hypothetical protein